MEFEVVPEEDLDGHVEGLGQGDRDPIKEEEALVERHLDGDALPLPVFVTDELLVEDVDFVCEAVAEEDTDEWPDALSWDAVTLSDGDALKEGLFDGEVVLLIKPLSDEEAEGDATDVVVG